MFVNNNSSIHYGGENVNSDFEILSDVNKNGNERPWQFHKLENERLFQWIVDELERGEPILNLSQSINFDNCASWLLFGKSDSSEERKKLKNAPFCRSRVCPMCNWRRSLKLFSQVCEMITKLDEKGDFSYLFLTLTLKNCDAECLESTINKINYSFKKFTFCVKIKNMLLGYMKAVEITYNSTDCSFHPHIHCILQVSDDYFRNYKRADKKRIYVTHREFREIWRKCLGVNYLPQVNIKKIKGVNAKAIAEVAKYPTKINKVFELGDEEGKKVLRTFYFATKNKRLVSFGGMMKEIRHVLNMKDIESDDDLVNKKNDEELPVEDLYWWRFGNYIKSKY